MREVAKFKPGDFVIARYFQHQHYHYTAEEDRARTRELMDTGLTREGALRAIYQHDFLVHPGHVGRITSIVALRPGYRYRVRWLHDGKLRETYGNLVRSATPIEVLARQEAMWSQERS